jgi:hypothetical protein
VGDGWMPIEIGDDDEVYARATGQMATERVEFISNHEPDRLILDPHLKAHDWNALNNRERRLIGGRGTRLVGRDDPTRDIARRDRIITAILPLLWSNDYGGRTAALRARENYLGRFDKNLAILSVGLGPAVTHRLGWYVRFGDPVRKPLPRTEASVALWNVEGRAGAAMRGDRSLRRHLAFGADPHVGFDALWTAVTDIGYVDRRLWDPAGTIEAGPWISTTSRHGNTVWRGRVGARVGLVYRNPGPGTISANRYDVEGFGRGTAEVSVRAPFPFKSVLGVRLFGGTYLAPNTPPLQRRIMLAGADPYETFMNPLLRSRGALFVRPDFHYHAPGNANLRGFRPDLGGRWAVAMNVEGTKTLFSLGAGLFTDAAFEAFLDAGMVDPRAVPPRAGAARSYTSLLDAGVGLVTRHRINDLAWTLRFELPLVVTRPDYAADWNGKNEGRLAFRWQVSLEPTF